MEYERKADDKGHFYFEKYTENTYIECMCPSAEEKLIPKFHNSVELIVVVSGEYYVLVNGERKRLKSGEVIYIDNLVPHATSRTERYDDLEVYALVITPQYICGFDDVCGKRFDTENISNDGFSELKSFLDWGYSGFKSMNQDMKTGFATLLFGILKKHCPLIPNTHRRQNELILLILTYIDEHYAEKINLSVLAKKFGYEETYLSRVFNSFMGINLREYLGRYRIAKVNKLRATAQGDSVLGIAEKCGFESPNTFYRALKKYSDK